MVKPSGQADRPQPFQPRQSLGQHFLRSDQVVGKIVDAARLTKNDVVVEVGPGEGILTHRLARTAKRVIAIEKDPRLIPILRQNLREFTNVEIVSGDVRKIFPRLTKNYRVVANLPYYAATHIIRMFLEADRPPQTLVLMLQKEVAQRICSRPPAMNLLATSVQFYARAQIVCVVPKRYFWPRPKVDSAVIKLETLGPNRSVDQEIFFKIVKAGFTQPRKRLVNNLARGLKLAKADVEQWLAANGISPAARAQNLGLDDWLTLAKTFALVLQ